MHRRARLRASAPAATLHDRAPYRHRGWSVALIVITVTAGCDSPGNGAQRDVAAAYELIIEWFADRSPSEADRPVVFVMAQGEGFDITLSLQAAVIDRTEDQADVRFVDEAVEAFGDDDAVRQGDVLLAVGPVVTERREAAVSVDEVQSIETVTSWHFELGQRGDGWRLVQPPTTLAP